MVCFSANSALISYSPPNLDVACTKTPFNSRNGHFFPLTKWLTLQIRAFSSRSSSKVFQCACPSFLGDLKKRKMIWWDIGKEWVVWDSIFPRGKKGFLPFWQLSSNCQSEEATTPHTRLSKTLVKLRTEEFGIIIFRLFWQYDKRVYILSNFNSIVST